MPLKKKKRVVRKRAPPKKKPARKIIKRAKKVAKRTVKKIARKPAKKKKPAAPKIAGKVIGAITHYFPKVRAAVIKLKSTLNTGDTIRVIGHTTDFTQTINSMEIDHVPVTTAGKGAEIGLLVISRVREHDAVIKV